MQSKQTLDLETIIKDIYIAVLGSSLNIQEEQNKNKFLFLCAVLAAFNAHAQNTAIYISVKITR